MNLSCDYLGLKLARPLLPTVVPHQTPLAVVEQLEAAGAGALLLSPLPDEPGMGVGREAERYLEALQRLRRAVALPLVAALDGDPQSDWLGRGRRLVEAGAQALEFHLPGFACDGERSAAEVEAGQVAMVRAMDQEVRVPVAVKLGPHYSSLLHFLVAIEEVGARGATLFGRYALPDIDPTTGKLVAASDDDAILSDSELRLRLRWLSLLPARLPLSLAFAGGAFPVEVAQKAILAGAHVVQLGSAPAALQLERLSAMVDGLQGWLARHEVATLAELRGRLKVAPAATERLRLV